MADQNKGVGNELLQTVLHQLHVELGGRMVPFAGYDMAVQYEGVVAEHLHTRASAGLFDVSHMGVLEFHGDPDKVGQALETLLPSAITTLKPGRQRYSFLTNESGGVIDDLMIARTDLGYSAVVNASRKAVDIAHLRTHLSNDVEVVARPDIALVALQGPEAISVVTKIAAETVNAQPVADMAFMDVGRVSILGVDCGISRSGYTGEDGVEIAIPAESADDVVRAILADDRVKPIGLGARDTLRLEAGLCLYGNDLTTDISPVEADLLWAIQKRRREHGGFLGDTLILDQIEHGVARTRVGIKADGRRPVRDHSDLRDASGNLVGLVTSGGFGPSVDSPVAMGYVSTDLAVNGTQLVADVRGKDVAVQVAPLPFSPHRYHRS